MRALAFDPAKDNFGYFLAECFEVTPDSGLVPRMVESGFVTPLSNLSGPAILDWAEYIRGFFEASGLSARDLIVCERYQFRGRSSVHAEIVNVMIGILSTVAPCRVELITPSSWKTHLKMKHIKLPGESPHERDALGMLIYQWRKDNLLIGKRKRK